MTPCERCVLNPAQICLNCAAVAADLVEVHLDLLVTLIRSSLHHGGCANCGGFPHTETCYVGRLWAAFVGPLPEAPHPKAVVPLPKIAEIVLIKADTCTRLARQSAPGVIAGRNWQGLADELRDVAWMIRAVQSEG